MGGGRKVWAGGPIEQNGGYRSASTELHDAFSQPACSGCALSHTFDDAAAYLRIKCATASEL